MDAAAPALWSPALATVRVPLPVPHLLHTLPVLAAVVLFIARVAPPRQLVPDPEVDVAVRRRLHGGDGRPSLGVVGGDDEVSGGVVRDAFCLHLLVRPRAGGHPQVGDHRRRRGWRRARRKSARNPVARRTAHICRCGTATAARTRTAMAVRHTPAAAPPAGGSQSDCAVAFAGRAEAVADLAAVIPREALEICIVVFLQRSVGKAAAGKAVEEGLGRRRRRRRLARAARVCRPHFEVGGAGRLSGRLGVETVEEPTRAQDRHAIRRNEVCRRHGIPAAPAHLVATARRPDDDRDGGTRRGQWHSVEAELRRAELRDARGERDARPPEHSGAQARLGVARRGTLRGAGFARFNSRPVAKHIVGGQVVDRLLVRDRMVAHVVVDASRRARRQRRQRGRRRRRRRQPGRRRRQQGRRRLRPVDDLAEVAVLCAAVLVEPLGAALRTPLEIHAAVRADIRRPLAVAPRLEAREAGSTRSCAQRRLLPVAPDERPRVVARPAADPRFGVRISARSRTANDGLGADHGGLGGGVGLGGIEDGEPPSAPDARLSGGGPFQRVVGPFDQDERRGRRRRRRRPRRRGERRRVRREGRHRRRLAGARDAVVVPGGSARRPAVGLGVLCRQAVLEGVAEADAELWLLEAVAERVREALGVVEHALVALLHRRRRHILPQPLLRSAVPGADDDEPARLVRSWEQPAARLEAVRRQRIDAPRRVLVGERAGIVPRHRAHARAGVEAARADHARFQATVADRRVEIAAVLGHIVEVAAPSLAAVLQLAVAYALCEALGPLLAGVLVEDRPFLPDVGLRVRPRRLPLALVARPAAVRLARRVGGARDAARGGRRRRRRRRRVGRRVGRRVALVEVGAGAALAPGARAVRSVAVVACVAELVRSTGLQPEPALAGVCRPAARARPVAVPELGQVRVFQLGLRRKAIAALLGARSGRLVARAVRVWVLAVLLLVGQLRVARVVGQVVEVDAQHGLDEDEQDEEARRRGDAYMARRLTAKAAWSPSFRAICAAVVSSRAADLRFPRPSASPTFDACRAHHVLRLSHVLRLHPRGRAFTGPGDCGG